MRKKLHLCIVLALVSFLYISCSSTPVNYYVSFFSTEEVSQLPATQLVREGEKVIKPADPVREGYTFKGWTQDPYYNMLFDFESYAVIHDLSLYAVWAEDYTISFVTDKDDVSVNAIDSYKGAIITELPVPSGYRDFQFVDWYYDKNFTQKVILPITIDGSKTLYAQWKDLFVYTPETTYGGYKVTVADTIEPVLTIPSEYKGLPVTVVTSGFSSSELQSITFPSSLCEISDYAFNGMSLLTEVHFSTGTDNLKRIGTKAFYNTGIKSLNLPVVDKIDTEAFGGCSDLETIYLASPAATTYSADIFSGSKLLENIENVSFENITYSLHGLSFNESGQAVPDSYIVTGTSDRTITELVLPDTLLDTIPVTIIADNAFSSMGITSVTLPSGLKEIGNHSFSGCEKLKSVTIPSSVEKIGNYAFNHCVSLLTITFGEKTPQLGYNWNYETAHSTSGDEYFEYTQVSDVSGSLIGLKVTSIPSRVEVRIPSSATYNGKEYPVVSIGKLMNEYTTNITTTVHIPESVVEIKDTALEGSSEVLEYICFDNWQTLECIEAPSSVSDSAYFDVLDNSGYAFKLYDSEKHLLGAALVKLNVEDANSIPAETKDGVPIISLLSGSLNYTKEVSLDNLVIPENVRLLAPQFFAKSWGNIGTFYYPNSVELPQSLLVIGTAAFSEWNLTEVTIPDNVVSIGDYAFAASKLSTKPHLPAITKVSPRAFLYTSFDESPVVSMNQLVGNWEYKIMNDSYTLSVQKTDDTHVFVAIDEMYSTKYNATLENNRLLGGRTIYLVDADNDSLTLFFTSIEYYPISGLAVRKYHRVS